ncbi:hypothetical protein F4818DRAFT_454071 [Hypoxylon cercidicola]|nr:hypothetical protein F4818DRAFT_454071 [Hypoxylon cercidicola]
MCSNCSKLVRRNFSCGHQLLLRIGKVTFCLYYPHTTKDYHAVVTQYDNATRDHECKECAIRKEASNKGLRGAERLDFIKNNYAKTWEAKAREEAKKSAALANTSQQATDPETIVKLNKKAESQVKFYLAHPSRYRLDTIGRAELLKTILRAPDAIDRKALVTLFGSYSVFDQKENVWKGMPVNERNYLLVIARHAGLSRTLEYGLSLKKPEDLQAREKTDV